MLHDCCSMPAQQTQQPQHQRHLRTQQQQQQRKTPLPSVQHSGRQRKYHQSALPASLLRLEAMSVSLESLLFDQAGLDSKFNNSTSATGTMQSTNTTISTTSGASVGVDKQTRQLVQCLKSIDTTLLKERKNRYRISCSFRTLDSNCKSLVNFLRGKSSNAVPSPKEAVSDSTAGSAVVAHQQRQNGFRMLLNRKLVSEGGENDDGI